ncbi:MAG: sn-glycerol-1-phosphate dehydrogenase [Clostridiales bacterium]|nr:sn-glycerol-1-phosphate dehydrogenase [Clostridiales bacterium]
MDITRLELSDLLKSDGFKCSCGKFHHTDVEDVVIGHGVLKELPNYIRKHGGEKIFLLADQRTHKAAGKKTEDILCEHEIPYALYIYPHEDLEPNELALGQVAMNFDEECNLIISIGSGTLNDIGKMLAKITGRKYMVIATAPSMDGYASNNSSMISAGIKVTIPSKSPILILSDLDVVCQAPVKLLQAGLGDMLAKYISICEWRISHLINSEYYCEQVADLVRSTVKKCLQSAGDLLKRDSKTIKNIMEGLILSGIAMSFAGISRPASGVEHYFSHIWDMRALEFQTNSDFHGIQVGIGTVLALKVYEHIPVLQPNKEKALDYVARFQYDKHKSFLKEFLGSSASNLILLEQKEGKYDKTKHYLRLERILENWNEIIDIINQELPDLSVVQELLQTVGAPIDPAFLGFSPELVKKTFYATKDIRDKYSVSRLLWDIGELERIADKVF